jgi:hypothetical protein
MLVVAEAVVVMQLPKVLAATAVLVVVPVDREQALQVAQVLWDKVKTAARQHQAHLITAVLVVAVRLE